MSGLTYAHCTACGLCRTRRRMVVGRGTMPADILYIGEAPGVSEDMLGEPFVGPSGRLLERLMHNSGNGDLTYYITNTVWCRPCDAANGPNRAPTQAEALACAPNVQRVIDKVQARYVVLLGNVAEQYWTKAFPQALKLLHPAFLLRQGGVSSPHYTAQVRKLEDYLYGE